ncbi:pseudaminic acid cytidylyltransferase [Psychromonas antarctica]|jgi:pseudaminic acid cytidylyltransferase|uniref:pseudaminic acid cytidylyltransferase n=1 Tax=Psychromonas antarctica TaxID=67573 RepID=UPI001EE86BF8|nr:pseudaminic acid cytidylyltransferase [Psychromonas antarctica]MCG6202438.1 pseudaminic acid cytidylyltransferase [Psychromonas antarctica]
MNIAIIPARGGSKRILRKNIKLFLGKPIIAYSIEAAKQSGCFDKIIVSTDDQEIANVALQYGAEVPFVRPANIADDYATTIDVIQHALSSCEKLNWDIELACCIYATAPFITPESLQKGLKLLEAENLEYVFSATSFAFPIQRAITLDEQGAVSMFYPEYANTRSQDLQEAFHDAGQFYWGKAKAFREGKAIFSEHSKVVLLPRIRALDIDTPEDWELAEALFAV